MRKFWQGWSPEVYGVGFLMWAVISFVATMMIFMPCSSSDRARQWAQFEGVKDAEVFCVKYRCHVRTSSDTYDLWCASHCIQTTFDPPVKR